MDKIRLSNTVPYIRTCIFTRARVPMRMDARICTYTRTYMYKSLYKSHKSHKSP